RLEQIGGGGVGGHGFPPGSRLGAPPPALLYAAYQPSVSRSWPDGSPNKRMLVCPSGGSVSDSTLSAMLRSSRMYVVPLTRKPTSPNTSLITPCSEMARSPPCTPGSDSPTNARGCSRAADGDHAQTRPAVKSTAAASAPGVPRLSRYSSAN